MSNSKIAVKARALPYQKISETKTIGILNWQISSITIKSLTAIQISNNKGKATIATQMPLIKTDTQIIVATVVNCRVNNDDSRFGLGAAFEPIKSFGWKPVAFAFRFLITTEERYSVNEL